MQHSTWVDMFYGSSDELEQVAAMTRGERDEYMALNTEDDDEDYPHAEEDFYNTAMWRN